MWEKYYAWSPYQYSMNNPISLADWNGKWAVNASVGGAFTRVNENLKTISSLCAISQGGYAGMINGYYDSWKGSAPKVANFLKNNTLYITPYAEVSSVGGFTTRGGDRIFMNTMHPKELSQEGTAFHEIIHTMGEDEYTAWGASMAMGLAEPNMVKAGLSSIERTYNEGDKQGKPTGSFKAMYYLQGTNNQALKDEITFLLLDIEAFTKAGNNSQVEKSRNKLNGKVQQAVREMIENGTSFIK